MKSNPGLPDRRQTRQQTYIFCRTQLRPGSEPYARCRTAARPGKALEPLPDQSQLRQPSYFFSCV